MSLDTNIAATLRAAFALLFAAAMAHKLWHAAEFQRTLQRYLQGFGLAGLRIEKPLYVALVAVEALIVAACLSPAPGVFAGFLACATLLLYAAAIGVNLARDNTRLDCGCGWGRSRATIRPALVTRNVLLAVLALALVLPTDAREFAVIDVVSIAFATLTFALLYAAGNQLLADHTPDSGRTS